MKRLDGMRKLAAAAALAWAGAAPFAGRAAETPADEPPGGRRIEIDGYVVRLDSCPKCPMRARFAADGKTATVNTAKVAENEIPAMVARVLRLLRMADDTRRPGPKRPLMGWSSWNTFRLDISESIILDTAFAMATNGLKAAGYRYVNIDDGFFDGHDANGRLKWEPTRFPNGMRPVVDGIHALGMKAGTYSDAGADMCGGNPGSGLYGHDEQDCRLHFLELGFDFFKVDYCGGWALNLDEQARYTEIAKAIRETGRDVHFNVCRTFPGTWVAEIADSWRTTYDIRASWDREVDKLPRFAVGIRDIVRENLYLSAYISPGHYNDMDMLEVGQLKGIVKTAFGKDDPGLTPDEEALHFGMWCMMSSPLVLGCDVRKMPASSMALATNPYLLAMNQNDLGIGAYVVMREGDAYVLAKDAERRDGTARFVALYNSKDEPHEFKVPLAVLDLDGTAAVLDLAERADLGVVSGELVQTVRPHAAKFYHVDAQRRLVRTVYEAEDAFLSDYQELRPAAEAGTACPEEVEGASGGVAVRHLGNRASNDLVYRDVRLPDDAEVELAFDYSAGQDGFVYVQIDDGKARLLKMKATDGGRFATAALAPVPLRAGVHTVRVFNSKRYAPVLDRMVLRFAGRR